MIYGKTHSIESMKSITELSTDAFDGFFDPYFAKYPASPEIFEFESKIARDAERDLEKFGEVAWDFDIKEEFFGERGTSILIQNASAIDWQHFGDQLAARCGEQPPGSLINFEVWDNIDGEIMIAGSMLLCWILTSEGIFSQGSDG